MDRIIVRKSKAKNGLSLKVTKQQMADLITLGQRQSAAMGEKVKISRVLDLLIGQALASSEPTEDNHA